MFLPLIYKYIHVSSLLSKKILKFISHSNSDFFLHFDISKLLKIIA